MDVTRLALRTLMASAGLLLALGVLIWIGLYGLIGIHQLLGYVLIASLWAVAGTALRAGVSPWVVAGAVGWGLIVLALGWGQRYVLPGDWHWTIQVLHVVISMASVAWGRWLAVLIGQQRGARAPAPA
jgi:hypothetical protein